VVVGSGQLQNVGTEKYSGSIVADDHEREDGDVAFAGQGPVVGEAVLALSSAAVTARLAPEDHPAAPIGRLLVTD